MKKLEKYEWIIPVLTILLIIILGIFIGNGYSFKKDYTCSYDCRKSLEKAENYGNGNIINKEQKEIFKFQENESCPINNIDWDIAVSALSDYAKNFINQNPGLDYDFGPADIEDHFKSNCEQDLQIYNDYISK